LKLGSVRSLSGETVDRISFLPQIIGESSSVTGQKPKLKLLRNLASQRLWVQELESDAHAGFGVPSSLEVQSRHPQTVCLTTPTGQALTVVIDPVYALPAT